MCVAQDADELPTHVVEFEKHALLFSQLGGHGMDTLKKEFDDICDDLSKKAEEQFSATEIKTFPSDINATQAMLFFSTEQNCKKAFEMLQSKHPCRILTPDEIKHTERTFLKAEVEALTADNDALEQRIMKYDIIQLHEKKKFKPTFAQVKTTSQMFMLIDHNDDCTVSLDEFKGLCEACNIRDLSERHEEMVFNKISQKKARFNLSDLEHVLGSRCTVADFKEWISSEVKKQEEDEMKSHKGSVHGGNTTSKGLVIITGVPVE